MNSGNTEGRFGCNPARSGSGQTWIGTKLDLALTCRQGSGLARNHETLIPIPCGGSGNRPPVFSSVILGWFEGRGNRLVSGTISLTQADSAV
jgi:hypothetical protein